jgi:hypothetical protein
LDFDFVAMARFGVLKQKVKAPGTWLDTFFVFEDDVAEAKDRRIFGDTILHPPLIEFGVCFERHGLEFCVRHHVRGEELSPNALPISGPPGPLHRLVQVSRFAAGCC